MLLTGCDPNITDYMNEFNEQNLKALSDELDHSTSFLNERKVRRVEMSAFQPLSPVIH